LPSEVALRKGFFKDDGLEVEIIRMNVPNILTALVTGDIGYTLIFGSVVRGALRGMPMRALASLLDGSTHALVVKPEYKSGKELKGENRRNWEFRRYGRSGGSHDVEIVRPGYAERSQVHRPRTGSRAPCRVKGRFGGRGGDCPTRRPTGKTDGVQRAVESLRGF